VSHTIKDKAKLVARVRRLKGQVEAVERALDQEIGCADVLQLAASIRGAVNGLIGELVEDHLRMHVVDPALSQTERERGADELADVVRTYLR
jgi:DNA-binding FrmR family transcriptional regulator